MVRALGLMLAVGGLLGGCAHAPRTAEARASLQPGDAVGVMLVTGDVELGATGTVTEIDGNRIYARSEGDTVHLNSWIVACNGGYDKDSRYLPRVDASDPALPPGFAGRPDLYAVLLPQGLVGSPIGFRSQLSARLTSGEVIRWSSTGTYPDFEPMSVFRLPQVAAYWRALYPGKLYLVARAQDADGLSDFSFGDAVAIADLVDAGGGTPSDRLLRRRILTFYVRGTVPPGPTRGAL